MTYQPPEGSIPTLPVPDMEGWRSVHLIGIGGAGMSGIARLLLARGIAASGSDLKESQGLDSLRAAGASVFVGHHPEQVGQPDAVVASSAIPPDNPELRYARAAGLPVFMRAQALAALMRGRRAVAVAGTHGKTTTTSMIAVMLDRAGFQPSFVIGGDLNESGSGAGHGAGELFVAEADESDGSFLLLDPEIAVVTNVEEDHLDFYGSGEEIEAAFSAFGARARKVVACWDDPGVRRAIDGTGANVVRYGCGEGTDLRVAEIELGPHRAAATITLGDERARLDLSIGGRHNLMNAAAALGVASLVGLGIEDGAAALSTFTGVRRRFERRGEAAGATFFDDYAHHPSELAATLEAAQMSGGRVVAVFQPHRYTRTRAMWRSLGESLGIADVVIVTDVYGAGERPIPGVSGKQVVDALTESVPGKRVVYLPRRSDIPTFLAAEIRRGDFVLTLGAGDITMVGEETLDRLLEAAR